MNEKINMWVPLIKSKDSSTGYLAILTDDSLDRDDEIMSKSVMEEFVDNDYLPGFLDHDTKVLNKVCRWINRRLVSKEGSNAVLAEPVFFKSNPKAMIVKGMLDEGDVMGISISGLPKESDVVEIEGKSYKRYKVIEKLEASFCGIQSNRNSIAMRIAKSFISNKEKIIKKDKGEDELNEELKKDFEALKLEKEALTKELVTIKKEAEEKVEEEKKKEEEKVVEEKKLEVEAMKKELEALRVEKSKLKKELENKPITKSVLKNELKEPVEEKDWNLLGAINKGYGVKIK